MAPELSVVILDNASTDGTPEQAPDLPKVRKIINRENLGFAAAVNQGVRETDARLILLLNPDVRLLTAVDELSAAAERYGLAAGKLVDDKGRAQRGFTIRRFPTAWSLCLELAGVNRLWPSNPANRRYRYLDRDLNEGGAVEQPAGAFLMFRRDVWERLGGFDERFFPVWFEDVDFCKRAIDAGYRIEYVPAVQAEHDGGHSVRQLKEGGRARYWCVNLLNYASKHFRPLAYRAVCLAAVLTAVPRMVAGMIRARSLSPAASCLDTVRIAGVRLVSPRAAIGRNL